MNSFYTTLYTIQYCQVWSCQVRPGARCAVQCTVERCDTQLQFYRLGVCPFCCLLYSVLYSEQHFMTYSKYSSIVLEKIKPYANAAKGDLPFRGVCLLCPYRRPLSWVQYCTCSPVDYQEYCTANSTSVQSSGLFINYSLLSEFGVKQTEYLVPNIERQIQRVEF